MRLHHEFIILGTGLNKVLILVSLKTTLRAICDLPLGSTALVRPTAMINIIGEDTVPNEVLAYS